jgi:hypothetical protein
MAMQHNSTKLEKPALSGQLAQFSPPQVDESYFERLAVFGLACLAAAIVGKLTMSALTPQYKKDIRRTL